MTVLYEDEYILVCEKPAGIATQAGRVTDRDMVSEVNNYMRKAGAKASAYLIHRLDKPVAGILVFAKTSQAAAELNRQIQSGEFDKRYYAIVDGCPMNDEGILEDYMYKDSHENKAVIVSANQNTGDNLDIKLAKLEYKVLGIYKGEDVSINDAYAMPYLLDVHLITGRFHQIRCQLANIGHPIAGDFLYGAVNAMKRRNKIGLKAYHLEFNHPKTGERMSFEL